jgi:hypothetical protein
MKSTFTCDKDASSATFRLVAVVLLAVIVVDFHHHHISITIIISSSSSSSRPKADTKNTSYSFGIFIPSRSNLFNTFYYLIVSADKVYLLNYRVAIKISTVDQICIECLSRTR